MLKYSLMPVIKRFCLTKIIYMNNQILYLICTKQKEQYYLLKLMPHQMEFIIENLKENKT